MKYEVTYMTDKDPTIGNLLGFVIYNLEEAIEYFEKKDKEKTPDGKPLWYNLQLKRYID